MQIILQALCPLLGGGTGANSLSTFKTAIDLDKVNNTADTEKPISFKTQTALDLKLSASDTSKYTKKTYTDSALLTKITNTGNAATATKLATARKINGVDFDGSGDITITSIADAGTLTGTTLKSTVVNSSLTSVGALTSGSIPYTLLTGTAPTWNQNTSGNAATATKFATARKINGVDFDGSADITIERLKPGDEFGGGIVFYTWANGKHGLITAMTNLNISGTNRWKWSEFTNINTMAKSDGIGAGYKNMLLILARQGQEASPYAASVSNEFKVNLGSVDIDNLVYPDGVYLSDWYLPSKYELELIYDFSIQYEGYNPNPNWDSMQNNFGYWTSTEVNASNTWYYESSKVWVSATKTTLGLVRPIRMF